MPVIRSDMVSVYPFRRTSAGCEFLLLRRSAGDDDFPGLWAPPSGRVEPGETGPAAALRELFEETGLSPAAFYQANAVSTFYIARQDTIWQCPVFAAEVPTDARVTLSAEHDVDAWLQPEDALARLIWQGQRDALREILTEIVHAGPTREFLRIPTP